MKFVTVGSVLFGLGLAVQAVAQSPVATETRRAELRALASQLHQRDRNERAQARAWARQAGIPVRRELPNGGVLELQRITSGVRPIFYITHNILAAQTVFTDEVWPGGSAGLGLDGSGMTMSEWDGGAVYGDHPDLIGRVTQVDGATELNGHSTHVAGTLIGAGFPTIDTRGMAYAAALDAYDWNSDSAEMANAAADGRLVSNHSYGVAAGWIPIGGDPPDNWWWIGGPNPDDLEDPNFGYYDSESQLWDQIARDAPYFLIVKAAGNDRFVLGPEPGEEYTIIDQDGQFVATSTVQRPPDCAPAGFDCMPTHAGAKNILTVGAVDALPGGYLPLGGPEQVAMTLFSGWGPTDDGRIKPDLVGDGVFVFSAWTPPELYALAAGTSQATPNVSGSLLLLQQHYENLHGSGQYLRAASLKALAIHTADEAGAAPGPDYAFGWGLLNTQTAARVISDDGVDHQIIEDSLGDGTVDSHSVSVSQPDSVITATLVWADPPGTPPAPSLDPPDLMLVNDLDLRISHGLQTHLPWVLDPADPAAPAITGDNIRDNVEQVRFVADTCTYRAEVRHKGSLLDGAAQDYSLIISVQAPPEQGTLLIDEDFSGGLPAGWGVHTQQGVSWTINDPVPGDTRLDNHTGGSGPFAMVDNNFTNQTVTSLQTPLLDLSAFDSAVLRFRSYFFFDLLESIIVEVSTDGGSNWKLAWENFGEIHDPRRIVLDVSDSIAGQASVMLRFRYDSNGATQGNLWQIDDIVLEAFQSQGGASDLPGPAVSPSPDDGASNVGLKTGLEWGGGLAADSHDVFFGTSYPLGPGEFQGNQPGTTFDPGPLAAGTTYYWRVDEVNAEGSTRGCTWSFTTVGEPPEVILISGFEGDG